MAQQSDKDPNAVGESWFLSFLFDRRDAETMFEQIYQRSKTRWWLVDAFDFVDVPKRVPAIVYQRRIYTTSAPDEFVREYFEAPYSLDPDFDPYAPNPRGFDPAVRGSVEARSRELAVYRGAARASDDDPWYDVTTAYEHYAARTLFRIEGGYLEAVWLFSTGKDADPPHVLKSAIDKEARRLGAEALGTVGPYPANHSATISTGMRITRAYRRFAGGAEEFESKIVNLSEWASAGTGIG